MSQMGPSRGRGPASPPSDVAGPGRDRHRQESAVAASLRDRVRELVGAIAAIPLLGGACGDTADRDLCTQYAGLVTAADEWQQQDPLTAKADELRAASEEFQAELDQFQAVAEGRLDTAISTLRASIDAFRQAAIDDDGAGPGDGPPPPGGRQGGRRRGLGRRGGPRDVQCDAT